METIERNEAGFEEQDPVREASETEARDQGIGQEEQNDYEDGQDNWSPDATTDNGGLLGKVLTPVNNSFDSLSDKQKGLYILIIGIASILVGLALLVMLILRFV